MRHKVSASTGGEGSESALYYGTRNGLAVAERHAPLGIRNLETAPVILLAHAAQAPPAGRPESAVLEGWRDFRRQVRHDLSSIPPMIDEIWAIPLRRLEDERGWFVELHASPGIPSR